mmetsp:Transcript_20253/g.56430  ORF Transcript_20253/g.56430 Transcript_20253/m.56430 type:complete len:211 (-) Transcript_20253:1146-1778(-)
MATLILTKKDLPSTSAQKQQVPVRVAQPSSLAFLLMGPATNNLTVPGSYRDRPLLHSSVLAHAALASQHSPPLPVHCMATLRPGHSPPPSFHLALERRLPCCIVASIRVHRSTLLLASCVPGLHPASPSSLPLPSCGSLSVPLLARPPDLPLCLVHYHSKPHNHSSCLGHLHCCLDQAGVVAALASSCQDGEGCVGEGRRGAAKPRPCAS